MALHRVLQLTAGAHTTGIAPQQCLPQCCQRCFFAALITLQGRFYWGQDWAPSSNGECVLAQAIGRGCFLLTTN